MAEERSLNDFLKSIPHYTSFSKESHEDYCELELLPPNISCDDGFYPSENPYRRLTDLQYRNSVRHILGTDIEITIVPNTTKTRIFELGPATIKYRVPLKHSEF